MASNDDPFRVADQLIRDIKAKIIFVDLHAEATSEKVSVGLVPRWPGDGGGRDTHPHPNRGRTGLPGGTAYITDVGMSGPYDSVIGVQKELVVGKFLSNMPVRFSSLPPAMCGCVRS